MSESTRRSVSSDLHPETPVAESRVRGEVTASSRPIFSFSPGEIARFIRLYAANPLFRDTDQWVILDNPYRRPIHQSAVQVLDFSTPLLREEIFNPSALVAHRMLLNIYESDLLFLPERDFPAKKDDFALFYSNESKVLGEIIRPTMETHVFGFLEDEISITGDWSLESLKSYLLSLVAAHEQSNLEIITALLSSKDPEKNAIAFLIQVASDFLTESSASARNVLGKYGAIQSELFKILIDDYGHGVHQTKHSTLFENTMASCGLSKQAHSYWQFYLGSSLALGDYYHYVSRDHSKFFRCLGALAYAESMFAHTCSQIAGMLRRVLGPDVDTFYFDEHGHIDADHGRMALENLVTPAIKQYGEGVINEIVRGLEEIRLLTAISDEDFIAQITWSDAMGDYKALARPIHQKLMTGESSTSKASHTGRRRDPLIMHTCDEDKLCAVEHGSITLHSGYNRAIRIGAGEGIVIPRHRLNGIAVESDECIYTIYDLGDFEKCLS